MVIFLLAALLALSAVPALAQGDGDAADMCSPEVILASLSEAEDIEAWALSYTESDCSLRTVTGALALADAYTMLMPVELPDFPYAELPTSITEDGFPQIGFDDAPLTVHIYESFGCGHCANFSSDQFIQMLPEAEAGNVRMIFVPVTNQFSVAASAAAYCAMDQGYFWEAHDLLFGFLRDYGQDAFPVERIVLMAEDLGLDMETFETCLYAEDTYTRLDDANAIFYSLTEENEAVTGTPTITFNGVVPEWGSGAPPWDYIEAQIAQALGGAVDAPDATPEG